MGCEHDWTNADLGEKTEYRSTGNMKDSRVVKEVHHYYGRVCRKCNETQRRIDNGEWLKVDMDAREVKKILELNRRQNRKQEEEAQKREQADQKRRQEISDVLRKDAERRKKEGSLGSA